MHGDYFRRNWKTRAYLLATFVHARAIPRRCQRPLPPCQRREGRTLSRDPGRVRTRQAAVPPAVEARRGARRGALDRPGARPGGGECGTRPVERLGQPGVPPRYLARLKPQRLLPRPLPLPALAGRRGGRGGAGAVRRDACSAAPSCRPWRSRTSPAACRRCAGWRTRSSPTRPRCTRRCATWCGCSRAWPTTPRLSWPAWRAASTCSRAEPAPWPPTSAG